MMGDDNKRHADEGSIHLISQIRLIATMSTGFAG